MDVKFKVGNFFAVLRKEKNLTQSELADKLGVTDRAVSKWENGRCLPETEILKQLSKLYNVSINELLQGERNNSVDKHNEIITRLLDEKKNLKALFFCLSMLLGVVITVAIGYFISSVMCYKPSYGFFAIIMVAIITLFAFLCYFEKHLDKEPLSFSIHTNNKINATFIIIQIIIISLLTIGLGVMTYLLCNIIGLSEILIQLAFSIYFASLLPALVWFIQYTINQIKIGKKETLQVINIIRTLVLVLLLCTFPFIPAIFYYIYHIKLLKQG